MTSDASVDFRWRPVPDAKTVLNELEKRNRGALEKSLTTDLEAGAGERQQALAKTCSKAGTPKRSSPFSWRALNRSAARSRATFTTTSRPRTRRASAPAVASTAPATIATSAAVPARATVATTASINRQSSTVRNAAGTNRIEAATAKTDRVAVGAGTALPFRFFANWGVNQGANPSRVLAVVCRRGDVNGGDIGSIAVHPNATTFDVSADVAERFEQNAARKDPRTPQVWIRRDRGPQPSQGGKKKTFKKKVYSRRP